MRSRTITVALLTCLVITAAAGADDFVRGRGRIFFDSGDKNFEPLAGVTVKLMDSDWDFDQEIASGLTDDEGRFDLQGAAGDSLCGSGCARPDPYIKVVHVRDGRVDVADVLGFSSSCASAIREETTGTIDFGNLACGNSRPSRLFARSMAHRSRFRDETGESVPQGTIRITWPGLTESALCFYDTIHWPGGRAVGRSFFHEIGHRHRHVVDGDMNHWIGDAVADTYAQYHTQADVTSEGFAFNEGWADYARGLDDPAYGCGLTTWGGPTGDKVQGHVAQQLTLLSLQRCQEGPVGFKGMWEVLKSRPGHIHSLEEFRSAFRARFHGCSAMLSPCAVKIPLDKIPLDEAIPLPGHARPRSGVEREMRAIDARAERIGNGARASKLAELPPSARPVAQRLRARAMESARKWEATARQEYRRLVLALPPLHPTSLQNGRFPAALRAAREAFVRAVTRERLRDVRSMRREIASSGKRPADPRLQAFLRSRDARYAKLQAELEAALAGSAGERDRMPEVLLPRAFAIEMAPIGPK